MKPAMLPMLSLGGTPGRCPPRHQTRTRPAPDRGTRVADDLAARVVEQHGGSLWSAWFSLLRVAFAGDVVQLVGVRDHLRAPSTPCGAREQRNSAEMPTDDAPN